MSVFPPLPPPQINILDLFLPENQGGRLDVPFSVRLEKEEEDYDVFSSASSEDIFWISDGRRIKNVYRTSTCLFPASSTLIFLELCLPPLKEYMGSQHGLSSADLQKPIVTCRMSLLLAP